MPPTTGAPRGNDATLAGAAGAGKLTLTLEGLSARTDLIAIDGGLYDVKAFAPTHPGGTLIRATGGTDCSALFRSMHPHGADANLAALAKHRVGSLQPRTDLPTFDFNTPFANELRQRVAQVMGSRPSRWYAPSGFWLRTLCIMVATLVFEWKWATTGVLWWGALVGWMHAFIGLAVQHDASHGAFSRSPAVNAFFSYGADWIGNNRWLWLQQHVIGHHPHTNIEGFDPDAHSAEPVMLFHDYQQKPGTDAAATTDAAAPSPVRPFHAWQWLYMFFVLPWYGPSLVADMKQLANMRHGDEVPPNAWTLKQRNFAAAWRAFYVARVLLAPALIGGAPWLAALLLVPLVAGGILTFVFVVSHNFEGSDRHPAVTQEGTVDWYKLQVETSCSYGGMWAMFWSGGLNMQIEHHLFPRLSSWYYPFIAPVVKEVCAKHGVRYTYFPSLLANLGSTVRYMKQSGGWHRD